MTPPSSKELAHLWHKVYYIYYIANFLFLAHTAILVHKLFNKGQTFADYDA